TGLPAPRLAVVGAVGCLAGCLPPRVRVVGREIRGRVRTVPSCGVRLLTHRGKRKPRRPAVRTACSTVLKMRSREPESDAALMRAFADRDREAADVLYRRFSSRVYGLGIVMLGGDAAAQDLVQDTFVKLWRNAEKYDSARGKLDTWVLLVARSLAIDGIRRRVLDARTMESTAPVSEASPDSSPGEN